MDRKDMKNKTILEKSGRILVLVLLLGIIFPAGAVRAGLVSGTVQDVSSGLPVPGAVVGNGAQTVVTDSQGAFSATDLGSGLRIKAPGYRRAELASGERGPVHLEPFTPKALYLSFYGIGEPVLRDPAIRLIEQTELNALVIDFKGDRGMVPYKSSLPMVDKIGAGRITTVRDMPGLIADLKRRNIYTIARIVVFKDDLLARSDSSLAIKDEQGLIWRDGEGLAWADPFAPEVWAYNLDLAEEAARMGFDEVQFDYIRFPDTGKSLGFSAPNTEENRVAAISGFLAAANRRLAPYGTFLSADVFGYVCWNRNDTGIGQRLEDLMPHLDYLCPMLYPSGFSHGIRGYRNPVRNPFEIVNFSLQEARERTGLPAVRFRPWLQAFRDYAFDRRHFRGQEIRAQTLASEEFGANGWMLWNARNVYRDEGLKQMEAKLQEEPEILLR